MFEEINETLIVFPNSEFQKLLRNIQGVTIFNDSIAELRPCIGIVKPQIMNAMTSNQDYLAKNVASVYSTHLMPMFVHRSPLLNLLMYDAEHKTAYSPFDNCFNVLIELKMFWFYCILMNKDPTELYRKSYENQVDLMEDHLHDNLLAPLFESWKSQSQPQEVILGEFYRIMQKKTMQEIHLLERFIHQCLFEKHIPLETVLTPSHDQIPLNVASFPQDALEKMREQTCIYFSQIQDFTNAVLEESDQETQQWFNVQQVQILTQEQFLLPMEITRQFFIFMDANDRLK